ATMAPGTDEAKDEFEHLSDEATAAKGWDEDIVLMKKAAKEFATEVKSLNATLMLTVAIAQYKPTFIHTKVPEPGSALKQFRDVPANHWAAKAVRELRSEGILHGYPDGKYR
ncbi:MAG TPA: S-layer homology domain-containing protein, partial [Fimbriimonas sp.]|nr:S-layer homology domain-containing protein [Fimbriimonas sp.]